VVIRPDSWLLLLATTAVFIIGVPVATRCETIFGKQDAGEIVIDEVVGMWITMLFLPITWVTAVAGFVLFRIFDIWKPWPIRNIERGFPAGLGVMADDVLAGVYANLGVRLLIVMQA